MTVKDHNITQTTTFLNKKSCQIKYKKQNEAVERKNTPRLNASCEAHNTKAEK